MLCFCVVEHNEEVAFLRAFGQNLKRLREEKQLTQANVAFEAGLSLSQVQRIEYGNHNFSILTLLALAQALEVSPAALLNPDPGTTAKSS
ncbi:helix-turn-helix domain-containing protein [Adhaeribacter rhizoryzae]|uniref:Helix-turn-helix transcriptional regulator n=1 Tax=Adhaeribacter rhizoryzae TaxID=2607907 RepID=A0A5M6CXA4_9BACT|nr:helix-turn-helix transcriptional regulator [Adhaeribacter rhizoryzae]KAA5539030.1 helix-turn-helix transcriptional regulator [Adhaeribacter rhizoryzae]